jgi:hypothetical protein
MSGPCRWLPAVKRKAFASGGLDGEPCTLWNMRCVEKFVLHNARHDLSLTPEWPSLVPGLRKGL